MSDMGFSDLFPAAPAPGSSGTATLGRRQRVQWLAVHLDGLGAQVLSDVMPPGAPKVWDLPPAALLPRSPREPVRGDVKSPAHLRGTGHPWPPEARVDPKDGSGRWPIAYAWEALPDARAWTWHFEGRVVSLDPDEAIVAALSAVVLEQVRDERRLPDRIVLVIPNDLPERAQQALLDRAQSFGLPLKLLWRPIAAALPWLDRYQADLVQEHSGKLGARAQGDVVLGRLVTLHLGADGAEATSISIVARRDGELWSLLPGRHRPRVGPAARAAGRRQCERLLQALEGAAPLPNKWRSHWATKRLPQLLDALRGDSVPQELANAWRGAVAGGESSPLFPPPLAPPIERGAPSADALFKAALGERAATTPLLGVVVTGPLAGTQVGGKRLAEHLFPHTLLEETERVLIEGVELPLGALAVGAGRFAASLDHGRVAYLDTLPEIRIAVSVAGEPRWQSLLQEDQRWVEGGRAWQRSPRFSGLAIRRHSQTLDINLTHDEYPTVRMLETDLPAPPAANLPVSLDVSMEPAQGSARVEVIPEQAGAFGRQRVWVEWRKMTDTGVIPGVYLQERYPRIFPPLIPRHAHPDKWRMAVGPLEDAIRFWPPHASDPPSPTVLKLLVTLRTRLREPAPGFHDPKTGSREATAIGSDGRPPVPGGERRLQVLGDLLLPRLLLVPPTSAEAEKIVRVLGYTSIPDTRFELFLSDRLRRFGGAISAAEVQAAGWCLRLTASIDLFARVLEGRLREDRPAGHANWLKAFGHLLRQREEATREISSERARNLCAGLLRLFLAEKEKGKGKYVFRFSCLCIVYLLRRRMFDDDFLDPDEPLARDIKSAFEDARVAAQRGRLSLIGGSIDLASEFQRLIDYIDRRGHGLPGLTDEGQGGGDEE